MKRNKLETQNHLTKGETTSTERSPVRCIVVVTMSFPDDQIQSYLNACEDKACFCDGNVLSWMFDVAGPSRGPNCQVRDACPLFRPMPNTYGDPIKIWHGSGNPAKGCDSYQFWQREKRRQEEDGREWIVTMAGETRAVCGRDPLAAAIRMFFLLNNHEGVAVDKMVLLDKKYSVREP